MREIFLSDKSQFFLNIFIGLLLISTGFIELKEMEEEEFLHTSHAVILLGFIYLSKVIVEVLEGLDKIFVAIEKENKLFYPLRRLSQSFIFHFIIALFLIIVGLFEIIEEIMDEKPGISEVWHLGVIGAGFIHLSSSMATMTEAMKFSKFNVNERYDTWILDVFKYLNFPRIELLIGVFIISISIWEEIINSTAIEDVGTHHALALFAITRILVILSLSASSEVYKKY